MKSTCIRVGRLRKSLTALIMLIMRVVKKMDSVYNFIYISGNYEKVQTVHAYFHILRQCIHVLIIKCSRVP